MRGADNRPTTNHRSFSRGRRDGPARRVESECAEAGALLVPHSISCRSVRSHQVGHWRYASPPSYPPTQILIRLPMPDMRTPGACAGPSCGTGGSTRPGGLTVPLRARGARRLLEQRTEEPPFRQPQQEHHRKPERQQRIPSCPHARQPEPVASRGGRARDRASRGGHDERMPGVSPAPLRRGRGAGVHACAARPRTVAATGPQHDTYRQFRLHLNRRTPTRRETSGYWNPIGGAASSSRR